MPDSPDDFDQSDIGEFSATLDSSELAARLYSPAIFSRQGQVIFMTDFSKGFSGIDSATDGVNASHDIMTEYSQQSGLSMRMYTEDTDELGSQLYITLPFINARYYTVDIGYYLNGTKDKLSAELRYLKNGTVKYGKITHVTLPSQILLETFDEYELDISSSFQPLTLTSVEQHLRMTIDTTDNIYQSVWLNGEKASLPVHTIDRAVSSVSNSLRLTISNYTTSTKLSRAYIQWIVVSISDNAP